MSAAALCDSHSSTRRAAGKPEVEKTPGVELGGRDRARCTVCHLAVILCFSARNRADH